MKRGMMVNAALGPYHIYRADEMPWMKAILVQTNEPTGPFGAKAIAEIPKDGVAPALANAIFDATGVRIRRIPLTPQRVYQATLTERVKTTGHSVVCPFTVLHWPESRIMSGSGFYFHALLTGHGHSSIFRTRTSAAIMHAVLC